MKFRILSKNLYDSSHLSDTGLVKLYSSDDYYIDGSKQHSTAKNKNREIICFGKFLVVENNKHGLTRDGDTQSNLTRLLEIKDVADIQSCIHGRFVLIRIEDKTMSVVQDKFARIDVYYTTSAEGVAIATDLTLLPIVNECAGYNQKALAHMLTYYGNRPAKKQTVYRAISRLGVSENIFLDQSGMSVSKDNFQPRSVEKYAKKENEIYSDLFLQILEDEGSKEGNLVYLSSGWDSTSILAGLVHVFGSDKVQVLTGRMKYSERSGICNAIEMEKVAKFVEHYKVKLEIVDFNYANNGVDMVESAIPVMKKHGYYNITAINHSILADAAKKIIGDTNQVIFAGEISDGAHNFGFSQYATIFHPSYGFREYADKMVSYLFGPTFLKRIIEGDYKDDPIYKLFYSEPGFIVDDSRKNEKEIKLQLFIDFFLRNGRRPFWSGENIKILTKDGLKQYTDFHCDQYLSVAEDANTENIYSYYLHLYNSIHWQGSTVAALQIMAEEHGLNACLPFWDKRIQDYLSVMPEDWGRGLDLNNTKYPLKWMLENKLEYPMELQEGPHSYTYDVDHSFNHYEEILCHSALALDVKKVIKEFDAANILSADYFNMEYIKDLSSRYLEDLMLSGSELTEIASLYFLAKTEK